MLARYLDEPDMPDVDMFLRPSGEQRTSNFLIWQSAYAELVFQDTLFPDFDRRDLWRACEVYASRQRRFGGVIDPPARDRHRDCRCAGDDDPRHVRRQAGDGMTVRDRRPDLPPPGRPRSHDTLGHQPSRATGPARWRSSAPILLLAIVFRGSAGILPRSPRHAELVDGLRGHLRAGHPVPGARVSWCPVRSPPSSRPTVFSEDHAQQRRCWRCRWPRHLRRRAARLRMRVGAHLEPVDRTRGPAVGVAGVHAVRARRSTRSC